MIITDTTKQRFFDKVEKTATCWNWNGSTINGKYGHMFIPSINKNALAHRISWVIANGEIPEGEGFHGTCVLHKCDNPKCVNPDHLFIGTHKDNMADRQYKGRHPNAKLNVETAREVKSLLKKGVDMKDIAIKMGVHKATISDIFIGRAWKHA
jgi:hypothetical protein